MKKSKSEQRPSGPVDAFHCLPIPGARLTRTSCGTRHENASQPWEPGTRKVKVWSVTCAGCVIGAAHSRGETPTSWPGGAPIISVQLVPLQALVRSRPVAKPLTRKERLESLVGSLKRVG